jgi:rhodanese-related sulfurtransferase
MRDSLPPVPMLAPGDLARLMADGQAVALLDVREDAERAFCRINPAPDAVDLHVPLGRVPFEAARLAEASRGRTLVVYCHHGMRSMVAARWLATQGLDAVANLDGGIDAWSLEVDPEVPRYD